MSFWRRFCRNRLAVVGLVILGIVIFIAATAQFFFPEDPFKLVGQSMSPPGENGFLLGSDTLGRDVAAGMAHGARVSLLIGLLATSVAVTLGVFLGAFAGYFGGWVDDVLMRVTEMFQTIPSFIFAILIVAIIQPSIYSVVLAIAVVQLACRCQAGAR